MKEPKISVLIPTYNRPELLKDALQSVVQQSLKPFEVIVADDNLNPTESQKNEEVVLEFSRKYDFVIYYKNKVNFGPAGNYKNLFSLASGELIQFLGDDDILSPVALEKLSQPLVENKSITVSGGRTFFSDINSNMLFFDEAYGYNMLVASDIFKDIVLDGKEVIEYCYKNGLKNIFGSFSGFMFRKGDVDFELFNFNGTEIIANSDIFLWMSLLRKGKAFLSKHFLNIFRLHGENDQFKKEKTGLEETLLFYTDEFLNYVGISNSKLNPKHIQKVIYNYIRLDNLPNNKSKFVEYFVKAVPEKSYLENNFLVLNHLQKDLIDKIKSFDGKYILFLHGDDLILNPNWESLVLDKFKKDETIAAISGISNKGVFEDNMLLYIEQGITNYFSNQEIVNIILNTYKDTVYPASIISKFCFVTKKDVFLDFYQSLNKDINHADLWLYYSIFLKEKNYKHLIMPSLISYSYTNEKTILEDEKFIKKLIKKYGYGNVPEPYEYFYGEKNQIDYPFLPVLKSGRYRFVFNFSGKTKNKEFFGQKAKFIKSNPKVCVVTVNYKTYEDIKNLAKSIAENRYPNVDFVVVDNSEDEVSFSQMLKEMEDIFSVSNKRFFALKNQNTGYAGGNNIGIKFCVENLKPEYIWILNPDIVINQNTIFELIKTVEYTDVPVATCKMIDSSSRLCQYNGKNVSYGGGVYESFGIFRASFLTGANIFMKAEVLQKVGLFEEKFFLYFEDNEYKLKMEKAGILPLYTPFCYILHKGAASTEGYLKNPLSVYYYVRNLLHFQTEKAEKKLQAVMLGVLLREEVEKLYISNIRKKDILTSIIAGIYDYWKGIYGKINLEERILNIQRELQEDKSSIDNDLNSNLEQMFKHMIHKPKDIDTFKKLTNALFCLNLSRVL